MKCLRTLAVLSALTITAQTAAYADTILLGSYGTGPTSLTVSNTATSYSPSTSMVNTLSNNTYNIDPGTTWVPALPNSSYISFSPLTAPGQSYVAPLGDYFYTTSFFLTPYQAAVGVGTLSVLADDTVAVYLNGNLILASAGPIGASNTYVHCSDVVPNCTTPDTFSFGGLVAGNNVLTFDVKQVNYYQEGLDFSGTVVAVPEPGSLALFGSGLLGVVGLARRRFRTI